MSPRGVAIPQVRQRLFAALERVVVRDGPEGLSGRAVTREAGVAAGLLHAHFADFDEFLAGFAVDRSFQASAYAARLPERAGTGTVAGNLAEAVLAPPVLALSPLVRILASRPALHGRVGEVLGRDTAGLDALRAGVATYLLEERRRGRLAPEADHDAIALALVGALHHLLLAGGLDVPVAGGADGGDTPTRTAARGWITRVAATLAGVPAADGPPVPGRSATGNAQA